MKATKEVKYCAFNTKGQLKHGIHIPEMERSNGCAISNGYAF